MHINTQCNVRSSAVNSANVEPQMDNSQTVGDMMNSFWTYFSKIQQSTPTDAEIKQLMQTVNGLQAYFSKNGNPTFANNPKTWEVYNTINNLKIDGVDSLADYSKLGNAASIQAIESPSAQFTINAIVWPAIQGWYGTNPTIQQAGDATFEADMKALAGDLKSYAASPIDKFAKRIADDIASIEADKAGLPGGDITDGYLATGQAFIKANSLDTLAAAYETDPTKLAAFEAALNSTSSASSNKTVLATDFLNVINASGAEEYSDWS